MITKSLLVTEQYMVIRGILNHERLEYRCLLPQRSTELCLHFGYFGITGDVIDLQSSFVISGQVQNCVDVNSISRRIDFTCVITEIQQFIFITDININTINLNAYLLYYNYICVLCGIIRIVSVFYWRTIRVVLSTLQTFRAVSLC